MGHITAGVAELIYTVVTTDDVIISCATPELIRTRASDQGVIPLTPPNLVHDADILVC